MGYVARRLHGTVPFGSTSYPLMGTFSLSPVGQNVAVARPIHTAMTAVG